MKLLLDTHLLLWAAGQPERLSASARALIEAPGSEPCFSAASLWEIAIKAGLRRQDFQVDLPALRGALSEMAIEEVPITSQHAVATVGLPPLHKDPFDRILVAQAMIEGITLLTTDRLVAQYPGPVRRV